MWWKTLWRITSELWKLHSVLFWDTTEKVQLERKKTLQNLGTMSQCLKTQPRMSARSTAWFLKPEGCMQLPRAMHTFSVPRQLSMHIHSICETNAALLLQGLWMCLGHNISDSCFIFDVLTVILPVLCLHHKDGGYSFSPHSLLLLGSTSPHHLPQMEIWAPSWEEEPQLRNTSETFLIPWLRQRTQYISQQLPFNKRKPQPYRHSLSLRGLQHPTCAWAAARDTLSEWWLLLDQPLSCSQKLLEPC